MPADPSSVSPSEREIEAVWEYLIQHTGQPGVIDGEWRKGSAPEVIGLIANALDRVRDARSDEELRAENKRLRELYANQAGIKARGWTIDHLMECEEALRMAEQRVAELEAARSPQGEDHEAVERLTNELQALVDWFNEAPFLRAERLLYDLYRASSASADYGEIVSHHPEGPDQIVSPQVEDHEEENDERRP